MTTSAVHPPTPPAPAVTTVGLIAKAGTFDASLVAQLVAHRDFSLLSTTLQRRLDRLATHRAGRAKILSREVQRTAKEFDVHETGEPYLSYQAAEQALRVSLEDGATLNRAALNEVLAFAPSSVKLWEAHKAAKEGRKRELDRIGTKIARLEKTRDEHLRNGIGARRKENAQTSLPNLEEPPKPFPWWGDAERQTVLDTLTMEIQIITGDAARAKAANDAAAEQAAEQDRRQHEELLASLNSLGLLDGLTPDIEDETSGADVEADVGDPELDEHGDDEDAAPEDPTQHPDLQPAIDRQKKKREAKAAGGAAKSSSRRKAGGAGRGRSPRK